MVISASASTSASSARLVGAGRKLLEADSLLSTVTKDRILSAIPNLIESREAPPQPGPSLSDDDVASIIIFLAACYEDQQNEPSIPLSGPRYDLEKLRQRIKDREIKPRMLFILTDFRYRNLAGNVVDPDESTLPTRDNLKRIMVEIRNQLRNTDKVLFHFGGHGLRDPIPHGEPFLHLPKGQRVFASDIKTWLLHGATRGVVLIFLLDACHMGNFFNLSFTCDGKTSFSTPVNESQHKIFTFAATLPEEQAASVGWPDLEDKHGAFTWYLLRHLPSVGQVDYVETRSFVRDVHDSCVAVTKGRKPMHPFAAASCPFPDRLRIL